VKKNYETFGDYILLEKLAAGGMAEVYLAKKIAASGVQKFVAIKRILQQFSDSEDFIAMFKDEAKIAVNLSHGNVVSIYDFGTEKSQFFIVMEFVEGRNLRQVLNRMKRVDKIFSVAQVSFIIKQVAAGLDHAHRCIDPTTGQPLNIIHRDMSPQNVMLAFEGDAKIVDFGIAKAAHQIEATRAGTLKGKFGYMSPEQVEGQSIDARTDIFALGIMAWEMLANQRLFLANSELNTLRKIRECNIPSLRKINPNIPAELDQIVLKALEREKADRYQTAGDLQRDLQRFLSRFDPDFAIQDLSQFVKNLFSEEIIQTRKKQIIYSQVTVDSSPIAEETEVVNTKSSLTSKDEISLDHLSFEDLKSRNKAQQSSASFEVPVKKAVGEVDFSTTVFDDGATRAQRIHAAKRNAHKQVNEYKSQTYTDTKNTLREMKKRNQNATAFTILFSLSFLMVFFAYINKYHPNFKKNFCKSMEPYGVCPRSMYIPRGLVSFTTSPANSELYINGRLIGTTPQELVIQKLPVTIDITKDGYRKKSFQLTEIPKDQKLSVGLIKIPTGYLIVRSVGVQIYINGIVVPSGKKFPVPANTNVTVRVVNPLTGQSREKTVRLKPRQILPLIMEPPTGGGL
jgi:serine/threonine protein kinase